MVVAAVLLHCIYHHKPQAHHLSRCSMRVICLDCVHRAILPCPPGPHHPWQRAASPSSRTRTGFLISARSRSIAMILGRWNFTRGMPHFMSCGTGSRKARRARPCQPTPLYLHHVPPSHHHAPALLCFQVTVGRLSFCTISWARHLSSHDRHDLAPVTHVPVLQRPRSAF